MSAPTQDAAASTPTRQQARASARHRNRLAQARFAGYLAATAGCCGLATTADAAVISIDITSPNISGPNGGVAPGSFVTVSNWPISGAAGFNIENFANSHGLTGNRPGLTFAVNSNYASSNPTNFGPGTSIGAGATWASSNNPSLFNYYNVFVSPNFGPDSFMGFRFGSDGAWNYGYLEVTWDSATKTFEILSAAYESTPNTSILTPAPVPEPGAATMAFGALASLCLGGRALKRWKQQRRSEPQGNAGEPAHDLPQTAA